VGVAVGVGVGVVVAVGVSVAIGVGVGAGVSVAVGVTVGAGVAVGAWATGLQAARKIRPMTMMRCIYLPYAGQRAGKARPLPCILI
jgi:hypothetical protein